MKLSSLPPTTSIKICDARVIDPASQLDGIADIHIANGIIQRIVSAPANTAKSTTKKLDPTNSPTSNNDIANNDTANITIHAKGKWVIPGAIDLCARLREPGQEHKGTIHSETQAAAAGGVTHLCCPPDTLPIIDSPAVAALIQEKAHQSGYAHVLPIGAMTQGLNGTQLSEMHALLEAGCIGISQLRNAIKDNRVLLRCLEYAATFNITVFFQSVDLSLQGDGIVHESFTSTRLGIPGIPRSAETVALARDLLLVEQTGVTAHFGQLSCARSAEQIAEAQQRGLPITADIAAHQLLFNDESIDGFNSQYHVNPPFRSEIDRKALIEAIQTGVISVICSDHQPHETAARLAPFGATEPGISSIETFLPVSFSLVKEGTLSPQQWVACIANAPAKIINIDAGVIRENATANLSIFDPTAQWQPSAENLLSEGKNSPLMTKTLQGQTHATIHNGRLVFQRQ